MGRRMKVVRRMEMDKRIEVEESMKARRWKRIEEVEKE